MSLEISVQDLKEKMDGNENFVLIDVRKSDELEICKIDEAINIDMELIRNHFDDMDKNSDYVIMCRSGVRSMSVLYAMKDAGFTSVLNMKGGILAWANEIDSSLQSY